MSANFSYLSIAPMIDWSYTHFRVLMRLLAPQALVYTEMQTTGAVLHQPDRALEIHPLEQYVALQLGGAEPHALVQSVRLAMQHAFVEINLNLGCPSDKVQAGHFGACLMKEPQRVVDCIRAMKEASTLPITAKTRIGIDHQDSYAFFSDFVHQLVAAGCEKVIIHARKAWLNGLSPKQNRTIPPLHYDYVYRIKHELPDVPIILNGQILDIAQIQTHMQAIDGVMIGRLAYQNPYAIAQIHHYFYPDSPLPSREAIIQQYRDYVLSVVDTHPGVSSSLLLKPLLNFAHGLAGAKKWKIALMAMIQQKNFVDLAWPF